MPRVPLGNGRVSGDAEERVLTCVDDKSCCEISDLKSESDAAAALRDPLQG